MSREHALARLARPDEAEAVGVLKNALSELADVKTLDRYLETWGARSRYVVRRNPPMTTLPAYSVIVNTYPCFSLPPNGHGSNPASARRAAVREMKK